MQRDGYVGMTNKGHVIIKVSGKRYLEHRWLAEQALGKPLPKGSQVHHVNGVAWDNETPFNLVVCPDAAYHRLLEVRTRALGYFDLPPLGRQGGQSSFPLLAWMEPDYGVEPKPINRRLAPTPINRRI